MPLDRAVFRQQFEMFKERVERKSKRPFVSFHEGLPLEWEGYKETLRQRALKRLNADGWQSTSIGKGTILTRLIAAVEVPKEGDQDDNNLVRWRDQYGHRNRSHYVLLDAQEEPVLRRQLEMWAFGFYRQDNEPSVAFEALRALAGSRYDLLAYLFFLIDSDRFMPIGVKTFDSAFRELGIDLKTTQRCSWDNYRAYLSALGDIQNALREMPSVGNARLIDAHSFCWLLVRPEMERPDVIAVASARGNASNSRIFNAIERSVWRMLDTTENTVRHANGQQVTVTKKVKELWMSKADLATYLKALIDKQGGKCSLTGIPLHFDGEHEDHQRLPSLDRIDSAKHYEEGNLQIVCKFVNAWKSVTKDEEFRRLLSMVRGEW